MEDHFCHAPLRKLADAAYKGSRKNVPPRNTPDSFCRRFTPTKSIAALRKRELAYGRRSRLIMQTTKNRKFPLGNSLLYISLSYVALIASFTSRANLNNLFAICNSRLLPTNQIVNCDGRVRPGGRTLFFYYASSFSARSIRYPTPTWVWIRCGASGHRSNFLRRDAM